MKEIGSDVETIFVSKADQKRSRHFAEERTKDNALYQKRGGFKKEDIISGAMAECAVYKLLKDNGVTVKRPDFAIYGRGQKSYAADLTDGIHHFHVKGQTIESKARYGASWIMQRTDPILKKPEVLNYLVPCTVDIATGRVEIYGIMSIKSLITQGCIGECKLEWFRKTKVALYMDHIEGVLTKNARWSLLKTFTRRYK